MTARRAALTLGFALVAGCASPPEPSMEEKLLRAEAEIHSLGLSDDPAIAAQRAELDAAIASEAGSVVVDGVELRTTTTHAADNKVDLLMRVPLANALTLPAEHDAKRAASQVALARLEEVTLEQRVRWCVPSLDILVQAQREHVYRRYAERQRELLTRNDELVRAGLLDEIGAAQFDLAGEVSLARREPPPAPRALALTARLLAVLPDPEPSARELADAPEVVRDQLLRNHPGVELHRARGRQFEALARRERASLYPSLSFVDVGFEPLTYPGNRRQVEARVGVEVPFGRGARASQRSFEALARGQHSAELALVADGVRETSAAIDEVNRFRRGGAHWLALIERADAAERVADRWWDRRLAAPAAIARLLDEVYDARIAVLDAQERAGVAACAVLAATGTSIADWPR